MSQELERKFVKPTSISDSLKCVICSEVFSNATRLFCSHTFCFQCVKKCQTVKSNCPMCRVHINIKNMGPDLIAQKIIDELQVFCPVDDCTWKGPNSVLYLHYEGQCIMRNIEDERKNGKSYKKVKTMNFDIKDDETQQRINGNLKKGSLEARLMARTGTLQELVQRPIAPKQSKSPAQMNNSDYLESLFD